MSTQDGVLRKVYDLYKHPTTMQNCGDKGIVEMAKEVNIVKLCPRNKATVMILGNHSSGKSSFINCSNGFFFSVDRVLEGERSSYRSGRRESRLHARDFECEGGASAQGRGDVALLSSAEGD